MVVHKLLTVAINSCSFILIQAEAMT